MSSLIKNLFKSEDKIRSEMEQKAVGAFSELLSVENAYQKDIKKANKECSRLLLQAWEANKLGQKKEALMKLKEKKIITVRKEKLERLRLTMMQARVFLESQYDILPAQRALKNTISAQEAISSQINIKILTNISNQIDKINEEQEESTAIMDEIGRTMEDSNNRHYGEDSEFEDELKTIAGLLEQDIVKYTGSDKSYQNKQKEGKLEQEELENNIKNNNDNEEESILIDAMKSIQTPSNNLLTEVDIDNNDINKSQQISKAITVAEAEGKEFDSFNMNTKQKKTSYQDQALTTQKAKNNSKNHQTTKEILGSI